MMRNALLILLLSAALSGAVDEWTPARPDYRWDFPRDSWAHEGFRNEWWYFTGQLVPAGETVPRFGYQFTIFRVGLLPRQPPGKSRWHTADVLMGHAAVTDLTGGRHIFSEVLYRAMPELAGFGIFPDPRIAWSRGPAGGSGDWSLSRNGDGFDLSMADDIQGVAFKLTTTEAGPPLLQGVNGFSRKAEEATAASLYYSLPDLATSGWIQVGGRQTRIAGRSWMDHEFSSNVLQDDQSGWDWFSLRFDDGRVLMLFQLRDVQGERDYASGTRRDAGGRVRYLGPADFQLEPLETWSSPVSGARYPVRWRIRVEEETPFDVEALVRAQENRSRLVAGLSYWEGAIRAVDREGREIGRGYLEMTGYGEGTRPPL